MPRDDVSVGQLEKLTLAELRELPVTLGLAAAPLPAELPRDDCIRAVMQLQKVGVP
jgi:hypothetical protein